MIFPKGLVHDFGQKFQSFSSFYGRSNRPGKCVWRHSRKDKKLSRLLNRNLKKLNNSDFSKGISPWFSSKISNFPMFFLCKKVGKNLLDIILKRKRPFQTIKTRTGRSNSTFWNDFWVQTFHKNQKIKRSKNWDFSKGVGPWFWSTISIFLYSFFIILGKIGQEKVLDDVPQRKKTFLDYENMKLKSKKKLMFSKKVSQWFCSKIGHISIILYKEKQTRKICFTITALERKKCPHRL